MCSPYIFFEPTRTRCVRVPPCSQPCHYSSKPEASPVNQTVLAYHTHVLFCWDARLMLIPVYFGRWKESFHSHQPLSLPFIIPSLSTLLPLTLDVILCQSVTAESHRYSYIYKKHSVGLCTVANINTCMLMLCICVNYSILQFLNKMYGWKQLTVSVFCIFH